MASKVPELLKLFTFTLIINTITTALASSSFSRLFSQELSAHSDRPLVFLFDSREHTTARPLSLNSKNKKPLNTLSDNNQEQVMQLLKDLLKLQKETSSPLRSRSRNRKPQRSRLDSSDRNIKNVENSIRSIRDRPDRGSSDRLGYYTEKSNRDRSNRDRSINFGSQNKENYYSRSRDVNYYRPKVQDNVRPLDFNNKGSYNQQYASRSETNENANHSPVVKNLLVLRNRLSCTARDQCEDSCDSKFSGKKKNKCEDTCDVKYDCEEEPKDECENDECYEENDCEDEECTGSTKGEIYVTEEPGCPRC